MASTPPWLPEERPRAPLPSAAIQRASCMSVLGTLASLRGLQSAGCLGGVWCCWWRVALSLGDSRLDSKILLCEGYVQQSKLQTRTPMPFHGLVVHCSNCKIHSTLRIICLCIE